MSATTAPTGTALATLQPKGSLLRILGVSFGIAVIVGDTIGSGILRTPGEIAGHLGSYGAILVVWILGGVYALFCTFSVTELGTMLPFAGGWYVYSRRAMGDFAGFLVGSSDAVVNTVSNGYLAVAFGEFAAELQPAFGGHEKLLGVMALCLLALLNWLGLRMGSRAQEFTSLVKAVALIAFVIACFISAPAAAHASVAPVHLASAKGGLLLAVVLSLQAIIISYDGWYAAIYFAEEDEDPAKNLPRASIGGVLACAAIYLLVNLALFRVLPMSQFAGSHMPVADAAMAVLGSHAKQFILLISLVAAASTMNANTMITSRILFAMAREGMMPRWITRVNTGGTPTSALLVATVFSIALVLSGSFDALVGIAAVLFVANYVSGFTSLFLLRRREPTLARPFKVWCYPWSNLAVLLVSSAFLIAAVVADPKDALFTLALIALACPLYFLFIRRYRVESVNVLIGTKAAE